MLNFLLNVVNAGVVDNATSGDNVPDIVIKQIFEIPASTFYWIMFGVLIIGIFLGIWIGHLIRVFKDAPVEPKKNNNKNNESESE
jgi:hypothetical protein